MSESKDSAERRDVARDVEAAVLRAIESNTLDLPTLPVVASRVLAMLAQPDFSLDKVAKLIESDPILAARLLSRLRNAAFAGLQRLDSVLTCVTRLGARELRVFLIETSVRQVLESRNPIIVEMCRELWRHSLAVAVLSRDLAVATHGLHPDTAYLAGLLHDVGRPVLAAKLLESEQRLLGVHTQRWIMPSTWLAIIADRYRSVGAALAANWGLPESVARAIRHSATFDTQDRFADSNLVSLADLLSRQQGIYVGPVEMPEVDRLVNEGRELLSLDEATLERILRDLDQRIGERLGA
jgi:HD-like signal output (HDOD) protein